MLFIIQPPWTNSTFSNNSLLFVSVEWRVLYNPYGIFKPHNIFHNFDISTFFSFVFLFCFFFTELKNSVKSFAENLYFWLFVCLLAVNVFCIYMYVNFPMCVCWYRKDNSIVLSNMGDNQFKMTTYLCT